MTKRGSTPRASTLERPSEACRLEQTKQAECRERAEPNRRCCTTITLKRPDSQRPDSQQPDSQQPDSQSANSDSLLPERISPPIDRCETAPENFKRGMEGSLAVPSELSFLEAVLVEMPIPRATETSWCWSPEASSVSAAPIDDSSEAQTLRSCSSVGRRCLARHGAGENRRDEAHRDHDGVAARWGLAGPLLTRLPRLQLAFEVDFCVWRALHWLDVEAFSETRARRHPASAGVERGVGLVSGAVRSRQTQ